MEINKLLLEGYLVFGIILTYSIIFILGALVGYREQEKEYNINGEQIQSKKEKPKYGTKFTFME